MGSCGRQLSQKIQHFSRMMAECERLEQSGRTSVKNIVEKVRLPLGLRIFWTICITIMLPMNMIVQLMMKGPYTTKMKVRTRLRWLHSQFEAVQAITAPSIFITAAYSLQDLV